ncbi:MAG: hypothetical protein AAF961_16495, partial [Planctomycetota bacterium]
LQAADSSIMSFTRTSVESFNPVLDASPPTAVRWEFVDEPSGQTVSPTGTSTSGDLQGFSLFGESRVGVGIGDIAGAGFTDPIYDIAADAWLLASIEYDLNGVAGQTDVHLQIGAAGMNHVNASSASFSAVLGAATDPALNAQSQRHLSSLTADAVVVVTAAPENSGDFNVDGVVDGTDMLNWQRGFGATGDATRNQGDADSDLDVDADDLVIWRTQFGSISPPVATLIAEPSTAWLSVSAAFAFLAASFDSRRNLRVVQGR